MGKKTPDVPAAPTLGAQINDIVNAMPGIYNTSAQYTPLFNSLNLETLNQSLFGTPGGTQSVTRTAEQAGWYDAAGNLLSTNRNAYGSPAATETGSSGVGWAGNANAASKGDQVTGGGGMNVPDGARWIPKGGTYTGTLTSQANAGLLDILGRATPVMQDITNAATTQQRGADIADVEAYGARATEAFRNANPQQRDLLNALNSQAQAGLAAGGKPMYADAFRTTRGVRSDWANRGLGASDPAMLSEALALYGAGENARQGRQQFGLQVAGVNQNATIDPFMAILGRSVTSPQQAQAVTGTTGQQLAGQAGNIFGQWMPYANDNAMTAYNAQASANIAGANNSMAMLGGLMGLGGSLGGAALTKPASTMNFFG